MASRAVVLGKSLALWGPIGDTCLGHVSVGMTVEPFNDWFKGLFDLGDHVWHRGLANNQTHVLACIFAYQLLLRYNHDNGHHNGRVKWILDTL